MKDLFEIYEDIKAKADKAERLWDLNPRNKELEDAFDKAWEDEYRAFNNLANAIVDITDGKIDKNTAKNMIRTKSEELKVILAA